MGPSFCVAVREELDYLQRTVRKLEERIKRNTNEIIKYMKEITAYLENEVEYERNR